MLTTNTDAVFYGGPLHGQEMVLPGHPRIWCVAVVNPLPLQFLPSKAKMPDPEVSFQTLCYESDGLDSVGRHIYVFGAG